MFMRAVTLLQMKNLKPLPGSGLSDVYSVEEIIAGMKPIVGSLCHMCRCHPYHESPFKNDLFIKPSLGQVDNVALVFYDDL